MTNAQSPLRTALFSLVFAVAATFGLAACDSSGNASGGEANLQVRLTDAPGDIVEALVTVNRVAIVSADDTSEGDVEEGGIETLTQDAFQVDLTKLQNGVDTLMADVNIPAGEYGQIRLVTESSADVRYIGTDGDTLSTTAFLPSGAQSGVKVNLNGLTLADGESAELTLDFSVEESFVQRGNGEYIFKPVVQTQSIEINDDTDGDDS